MANQKKVKHTVRYDRLLIVVFSILFLTILIVYLATEKTSKKPENEPVEDSVVIKTETADEEKNYPQITIENTKIHSGTLILANEAFPCMFDAKAVEEGTSPDLNFVTIKSILDTKNTTVKPYTASDWEVGLDRVAAFAMDDWLVKFAEVTGNTDIRMIGGYKPDSADQDFHTGRTLILGIFPPNGPTSKAYYYDKSQVYAWVLDHCTDYGFILRYPEDKLELFDKAITDRRSATFRYVGLAPAAYMHEKNFCLEEFLQDIRNYSVSNMLSITNGDKHYYMYFAPADMKGQVTSVPIPSNEASFDISGNNVDGFIVTVYG